MQSEWQEFKLIVTEPPVYSEHFTLIRDRLIPFVDKNRLSFWITNYKDSKVDCILFRVKGNTEQFKCVESLLSELIKSSLIVRYDPPKPWSPRKDAEVRIDGLSTKITGFDPKTQRIEEYSNHQITLLEDSNFVERQEQLIALFESLGDCTKAVYTRLKSKPNDKWIMSLFLHLILNSMDYNGPDPPSEESKIRQIPVI